MIISMWTFIFFDNELFSVLFFPAWQGNSAKPTRNTNYKVGGDGTVAGMEGAKVLDFVLCFFSARAEKPEIHEFRPKFRKFRVNLHVQT